jgi:hypothetical protein
VDVVAEADRRYRFAMEFAVDQELASYCYTCGGVEGCDY